VEGARRLVDEVLRSRPRDDQGPAAGSRRLTRLVARLLRRPLLVPHVVATAAEAGTVADALGYPVA
jgi:hypothetical protein